MASGDMVDFQTALSQLQMTEGDLQNLIASGELKAFRSGGMMKFRKSDIDNLRRDKSTEPTIIIPAAGSGTNYDVPTDLGIDESAATVIPDSPGGAAPTVELDGGSGGMPKGGGTEEILFEDSELEIMPVEEKSSSRVSSSASSRRGRSGSRRMAAQEDFEDAEDDAPAPGASGRRSRAGAARAEGSPLMALCLVATALVFILTGSVFGVMLWKGYYSEEKQSVYVPGFLQGAQSSLKDFGNP